MSRDDRERPSPWSFLARGKSRRDPRRVGRLIPMVEGLEGRVVLTAYAWNTAVAPTGGDWDMSQDWTPVGVPGANDTATVSLASPGATITHNGTETTSVASLVMNSYSGLQIGAGTLSLGANGSTLNGPVAIKSGATLNTGTTSTTFGAATVVQFGAILNTPSGSVVTLNGGQTLTVNGTWNLLSGDTVNLGTAYDSVTQVLDYGVINSTNTTFAGNGTGAYYNQEVVEPGGKLVASGDIFGNGGLVFDSGALIGPTDLYNNSFNTSITIAAASVPMLSLATGGSNNRSFEAIDILAGNQPETTLNLNAIGTATTVNLSYVFPGGFTVPSGSTLAVGPNVPVTLNGAQTLTVNGTMTLTTGDTFTLGTAYDSVTQVLDYGAINAANASFAGNGTGAYYNQEVVEPGGKLVASGDTFNNGGLVFDSGAVIGPMDLSGNSFVTPITIAAASLPMLSLSTGGSDNRSFQAINILAGAQPQALLNLNAIGTASTASLSYIFPGGFTVPSGSTLAVGPNVPVTLNGAQTFTVNGTLNLTTGDTFTLGTAYDSVTQVLDYGVINAANTTFAGNGTGAYYNQEVVEPGGKLVASGDTFNNGGLVFDSGALVGPTDLANNTFSTALTIAAASLPMLSLSTGGSDNRSFQAINILAGAQPQALLNLNAIGTASTASLSYIFPSGFTVPVGSTLAIGPNVPVTLNGGQTFTVNGTMTLATGDTFTLGTAYDSVTQILDYGVINAANASFAGNGTGAYYNQEVVEPGGKLVASGDTFNNGGLVFDSGALVGPTDLANNSFVTPVTIAAASLPMLSAGTGGSDNRSFQAINILAGTQPEAVLNLNAIGTANTASPTYVFPSGFTVPAGATLAVAPNVPVTLNGAQTLTVNGTLNLTTGDTFTLGTAYDSVTQVLDYGAINATNASFAGSGTGAYLNQEVVESGGHLTASRTQFGNGSLTVTSGASITLGASQLANQFAVNSGATYSVSGNDFSNVAANGVVASGDANAHIPLTGNYWGSTVPATISAKITDHADNAALPTVDYQPFLSYTTGTLAAPKSASYKTTSQAVTLTATVSSTSGVAINEGTETFTILSGTQVIGVATAPVNVATSAASAVFTIPASTAPGSYTIMASYSGTANYGPAIDTSQFLVISPATTTTTVGNVSATYLVGSSQVVNLVANVASPGGTPNEGTVTFGIYSGSTLINSSIPIAVAGGTATTSYTIPANILAGNYTVRATYTDPADYSTSTVDGVLTVHSQATAVTLTGGSTSFNALGGQHVALSAQVTSPAGAVNEGSVTFAIVDGTGATVGTATPGSVVNGVVSVSYLLPASTPAGTYTIQATYNGTSDFQASSATPGTLTITPAATTIAATPATATFNDASQGIPISAVVTSPASAGVGVGTVTFTIMDGTTPIVVGPVAVAAGRATATATLPAALPAGTYPIQAVYSGGGNFVGSTDTTQVLVVAKASTSVSTAPASIFYNPSTQQPVVLGASVSSLAGRVDAASSVTFQVYSGVNPIGEPLTVDLVGGQASGAYTLPSGLAFGSYTISTVFAGTGNFTGSGDRSAALLLTGAASSIIASAGTPQSATAGTAFATPFRATVDDQHGNPVAGVAVTFAASSSGVGGRFAAGMTATVTTDAQGIATAPAFTAGTSAGSYTVFATVPGASSVATFSLTNTAAAASTLVASAGTPQSATAGAPFAAPLQVMAEDPYGNPVAAVAVTFAAPASGPGGSFASGASTTVMTDALGIAKAPTFTAGTIAGGYSVTATAPGVSSTATFILANTAGAAAGVQATAGTPQAAVVGLGFAVPFGVVVEDRYGNPVGNAVVTFAAPTSGPGGSFAAGKSVTETTDPSGIATAPAFTAGTLAGAYSVTASVPGATSLATFALANSPASASTILASAGTPQSGAVGVAFAAPFQATVKDRYGNPVAGVVVTFAAPASGPGGSFATGLTTTGVTDASGVASAPAFTAGTLAGGYTVTATAIGATAAATFTLANTAGAAAGVQATAGTHQSAVVGVAFATPLQATVRDRYGNPVAGVVVTFAAPASGPGGTFATGTATTGVTDATGVATAPAFKAGTLAGAYAVSATAPGAGSAATFALLNTSAAASTIVATAGTPQSSVVGVAFATPLQATVRDRYGNPVAGVTVTFTAPSTGAGGSFASGKTATAITTALGVATAPAFTAGTLAGGYTVTATAAGVSPGVTFSLVNTAVTSTTLVVQPNPAILHLAVTLTAKVASVAPATNLPTGSVNFYDGTKLLGSAALDSSGHATFTTTTLAFGLHSITASYAGDTLDSTSKSAAASLRIKDATPDDFDGDGKSDSAVYDQTLAEFFITKSGGGTIAQPLGIVSHVNLPVDGDFDGNGKTDLAIYDQTAGEFYVTKSGGGSIAQPLGIVTHVNIPVAGDYDGDGKTDKAIYDQTSAEFYVLKSGGGSIAQLLGNPAHVNIPVAGDFDGDGKTDLAIYDQTAGEFLVMESGGGTIARFVGNEAHRDVPVAADYDGDGKTDLAVFDPTNATFTVVQSAGGTLTHSLGAASDVNIPVAGDYDGDGKTDFAIYDATNATLYAVSSEDGLLLVLPNGNKKHSLKPV